MIILNSKFEKQKIYISEMIDNIMMAPIPPQLEDIKKTISLLDIPNVSYKNTLIFALIFSVFLKGIAKGDHEILEFLINVQNGSISSQTSKTDKVFGKLIDAIKEIKEDV